MLRSVLPVAARGAVSCLIIAAVFARRAGAQDWNDPRTRALVERATARRAEQLADTALTDYKADAHGYVTFLAQVGQGFPEPPKVVKADELALQVYWRAPNLSKQVIEGRRDTLLLPTDIQYHRDHLGIVQNNFPNIIRLGEGDEVRDVPHPLSDVGLRTYDFAISDSLRYSLPGRTIEVYEVKVRPKNDRQPAVVGAVWIDTSGVQVVRMAFDFTRASYLDSQLEDVSIVLENGLINGRFWLPRKQEIEIRRTGTWMDYPVRGIIRGRWEISNYQINAGVEPSIFSGPEIVQVPIYAQHQYHWPTKNVLDSLPPDVRAVTDEDVQRVQAEARALVRAQALQRAQTPALAARGVSQLVQFNRVEGLALGTGAEQRFGAGFDVRGYGRYGFADHKWLGRGSIGWQNGSGTELRLFGGRDLREVGDLPERSGPVNSLAAQEFGSDYSDYFQTTEFGASAQARDGSGRTWTLALSTVVPRTVGIHAVPVTGAFAPTLSVFNDAYALVALRMDRPTTLSWFGTEASLSLELRSANRIDQACAVPNGQGAPRGIYCPYHLLRGFASAEVARPFGAQRMVSRTLAGAVGGMSDNETDIPLVQELIFLGGPVTGPGYDFHQFAARVAVSQRLEWQTPIPFPAISLGRFGHSPAQAKLAPFVNAIYQRPYELPVRTPNAAFTPATTGVYPSVGLGILTFFDLVRFDVARGLRGGRWTFNIDVSRDLWPVL